MLKLGQESQACKSYLRPLILSRFNQNFLYEFGLVYR
uniref:Uncharacterized protein n=1 Tax=Rhizophora mucronata TaxID=61149 RepID=A0A2P2PBJ6_RHIMU